MKQNTLSRQITEGPIWKQLLLYFFPILLGTFFQQLYNMVDTIVVGRFVGTQALAAVGSTSALISLLNGFFVGLSTGATVLMSQFYGAEDRKGISKALHTGMGLSVILGGMVLFLGIFFGPVILLWMNTPDNCLEDAAAYARFYFSGAVFSMIYNMGAGILRAMGDSKRPTIFLMITCVINIAADLLFVVVFRMGIIGAAVATVLSQGISAVLVVGTLCRAKEEKLELRKIHLDGMLMTRILAVGVPAGLQFVTFDLANLLIQSGINSFGDVTIAAWTAYAKSDTLTWMISGAFGVSITTFVGQNFGAQKYDRVRKSVWVCMGMSVAVVGVLSILEVCFRTGLLGIYTEDPEVIRMGAYLVLFTVPFNFLFMPVEVLAGTMRGTGYSLMPTVITCVCVCVFRVVWRFTVVVKYHMVELLAICYPISWLLATVVFYVVYLRGNWLRKRIEECGMKPEE